KLPSGHWHLREFGALRGLYDVAFFLPLTQAWPEGTEDDAVSRAADIHPIIAAAIRSRVNGMSLIRTPKACFTALPIAAAVGPNVHSPIPRVGSFGAWIMTVEISGTSENFRIG